MAMGQLANDVASSPIAKEPIINFVLFHPRLLALQGGPIRRGFGEVSHLSTDSRIRTSPLLQRGIMPL
jgi:hypothetical protein